MNITLETALQAITRYRSINYHYYAYQLCLALEKLFHVFMTSHFKSPKYNSYQLWGRGGLGWGVNFDGRTLECLGWGCSQTSVTWAQRPRACQDPSVASIPLRASFMLSANLHFPKGGRRDWQHCHTSHPVTFFQLPNTREGLLMGPGLVRDTPLNQMAIGLRQSHVSEVILRAHPVGGCSREENVIVSHTPRCCPLYLMSPVLRFLN